MTQVSDEMNSLQLSYVRRLYDLVVDWYKNADSKAQAILTLHGAIITFITGFVVLNPNELERTIELLRTINYVFLLLMALSLIVSVGCALNSFRSRLNKTDIETRITDTDIPAEKMWFFGDIAFTKKKLFKQMVKNIDEQFELMALADQIHILSKNVLHKHQWVNRSFLSLGISLIAFILFIVSYIAVLDYN